MTKESSLLERLPLYAFISCVFVLFIMLILDVAYNAIYDVIKLRIIIISMIVVPILSVWSCITGIIMHAKKRNKLVANLNLYMPIAIVLLEMFLLFSIDRIL